MLLKILLLVIIFLEKVRLLLINSNRISNWNYLTLNNGLIKELYPLNK